VDGTGAAGGAAGSSLLEQAASRPIEATTAAMVSVLRIVFMIFPFPVSIDGIFLKTGL
jgi:hypothetical protein